MSASHPAAIREVMWKRVKDDLSFERARLAQTDSGVEISGNVLVAQNAIPLCVDYRVRCDKSWRTLSVDIEQSWHGMRRTLRLVHGAYGTWLKNGVADSSLAKCTDVDLGITPSTNALPIRRLHLAPTRSG